MSAQKYPRVESYDVMGKKVFCVRFGPHAKFAMPDRLTAERCAVAEEMEKLLRRADSDLIAYNVHYVKWMNDRADILKRLDAARQGGE